MKFTFAYTGIRTQDLDRSVSFYTDVLGLELLDRTEIPQNKGEFASVGNDAKGQIEINWYADDSPVAGPYGEGEELDHLAFYVEDFEAARKHLEDKGYPLALGPIESKNSIWAYVKDPDGIYVEFFASKHAE
ncbi:MAG: VOC family protein [Candidatus Thermoplasmatota archaeon]|nr:VOC family protein [Candidatus Thermoplasmatota archaeon]